MTEKGNLPALPDACPKRLRAAWGQNLTDQRKALGLSRRQLAEAMSPAVTEAAVGMWERGETSPRWHHQIAVCRVLHTHPRVLFPLEAA